MELEGAAVLRGGKGWQSAGGAPLKSGTMRIEALCPKSEASASISLPLLSDVAQLQLVRRSTVARSPRLPHPHTAVSAAASIHPRLCPNAPHRQWRSSWASAERRRASSTAAGCCGVRSWWGTCCTMAQSSSCRSTPLLPRPPHSQPMAYTTAHGLHHTQPDPAQSRRTQRAWTNSHPNPNP